MRMRRRKSVPHLFYVFCRAICVRKNHFVYNEFLLVAMCLLDFAKLLSIKRLQLH